MEQRKRIKLTGLWKNQLEDGTEFLTGTLGSARISIWPNGYKTEDKHPDLNMYLEERPKKERVDRSAVSPPPNMQDDEIPDGEVPF